MSLQRYSFDISTDTGTYSASLGNALVGALMEIRYDATVGDTGRTLSLTRLPHAYDTGAGWKFYSRADALQADFAQAIRQPAFDLGGTDTGTVANSFVPIVFCNEGLRVDIGAGADTGAPSGTLHVYMLD